MGFKPSKYQSRIYDFILNENGNAVINAVAGSGKTTTLLESLKLLKTKNLDTLFLVFNKSIKLELEEKIKKQELPTNINTCHGLGYSIIKHNYGYPEINNYKYVKLLRLLLKYNLGEPNELFKFHNFNESYLKYINKFNLNISEDDDENEIIKNINRLCDLGRFFLCKNSNEILEISKKYNILTANNEHILAFNLIKLGVVITNIIDYTDMLYLPLYYGLEYNKYDIVFIDECQDLNVAQRMLMLKIIKPGGRFIAVGDKSQAIYGFSGADSNSFNQLMQLPNTKILPLNECYRCGENILKEVKDIVPEIEAYCKNPKGVVNNNASINDLISGDMVLCRNTYPLVKLCLKLISENKKTTIVGNDIGKSLIKLMMETNKTDMIDVFNVLYNDLKKYCDKLMEIKSCTKEDATNSIEFNNKLERIQVLEAIFDKDDNTHNMEEKINKIFTSEKIGIILSTIHKAKGSEANRVFIIHDELIPSKFAKEEWEKTQEDNLKYVAYTRAKEYLGFINDFDAFKTASQESFMEKATTPKYSKHVGDIGEKYHLTGKIVEIKYMSDFESYVYIIEDDEGNLFEKWGNISKKYLTNKNSLDIGSEIDAYVIINKHTVFNNIKKNRLGRFSLN
jgi:superfamily I DNA/RNA helicase